MNYREDFILKIKQASCNKYNRENLAKLNLKELKRLSEELCAK